VTEFYAFGIVGSLATTRRALGSGTEGSNPAWSRGESVSPVHSEAAREKSRAFAALYSWMET
jgi:hypothetical protein